MRRLKGLIKFAEEFWDKTLLQSLQELDGELDRAEIVKPEEIPVDVITMNSTFSLANLENGEEIVYTLTFPGRADFSLGRISILSPMGTAVLGCRVGDTVVWKVPPGVKRLRVSKILYQPEASGDFLS